LTNKRKIFHPIPAQNLSELLKMQKTLINSEMARTVRFYPLLLYEVERKIKNMMILKICSSYSVLKGFLNVDENIFTSPWGRSHEDDLKQTKVTCFLFLILTLFQRVGLIEWITIF